MPRLETRCHCCVSVVSARTGVSVLDGERGWERPPSERRIYSPAIRTYASPSATCRGSLPTRACGASDPCGKATNPPSGGWRRRPATAPAAVWSSMRTRASSHCSWRPLTNLVGPLPDVGEPEGLCRADGERLRRREVGGNHNGAPPRQERNRRGFGGLRPRPSGAYRHGAKGRGFEGGRSLARQSRVWTHRVGCPTPK